MFKNIILLVAVFLATIMVIWLVHQMFTLAGYSENCLQTNAPNWCWEDK